jgi:cysteinyl-tRNA synthetase
VLFSVPSDPDYGVLSRRDRDAMVAGARVEVAPYKRDPADFVLWKPSTAGVIGWESPWGRGRPGWHIECSAMIREHLGETIDIHGGGLDLIFPHHENEIAQSRCAHSGLPLARYWVHNGFVDMGSEKMSKSLGNIVTPAELLEKGHRGETLRLALLSAHYRQPLAWTEDLIARSKATLDRLYRAAGNAEAGEPDEAVIEALSDDLNTPLALSRMAAIDDPATLRASGALLGLIQQIADDWFQAGGDAGAIEAKIVERAEAKKNRDFATADRIRDELKADGILLEDSAGGTTWRRE